MGKGKVEYLLSFLLFSTALKVVANAIRQEKEGIEVGK